MKHLQKERKKDFSFKSKYLPAYKRIYASLTPQIRKVLAEYKDLSILKK